VLALVNIRGVKWAGVLQLFITTVKVGSLLLIVVVPFAILGFVTQNADAPVVNPNHLSPPWPPAETSPWQLVTGFGVALIAVLWAYHGWMNIAPIAEEVKDPQKNIPRALLLGLAVVIGLYLGANLAYSLVIPQKDMWRMTNSDAKELPAITPPGMESLTDQEKKESLTKLDDTVAIGFARRLFAMIEGIGTEQAMRIGVAIAAAMILISAFGALNGNIMVGPRLLFAMGADGLAPPKLHELHPTYRTPMLATIVQAAWSVILVVGVAAVLPLQPVLNWSWLKGGTSSFDYLTDFAMFGAIIFETLAVATIFVFRRRLHNVERPYRCIGYPWLPALYIVVMGLVSLTYLVSDKLPIALVGLVFIGVGALVYAVIWSRQRQSGMTN
jgi:amino acid transporter